MHVSTPKQKNAAKVLGKNLPTEFTWGDFPKNVMDAMLLLTDLQSMLFS